MKRLLNLLILTATAVTWMGCSQTVILYKPSKYIDPLPTEASNDGGKAEAKVDPEFSKQWNLEKIGITAKDLGALENLKGNYNIKVAILSTGVDYNHEDLQGQILVNKSEITQEGIADEKGPNKKDDDENGLVDDIVGYDVVDNDGLAYDRHGAGTAVAGIIAAKSKNGRGITGIAEKVSLYPIRYINDNGQTSLANLLSALDVAVKVKPDVIFVHQLQFEPGGHNSDENVAAAELSLLNSKLNEIKKLDIPVVVGSGDNLEDFGANKIDKVLKSYSNIIIVTSSNQTDNIAFIAKGSFGGVHTSAPGEDIRTTLPQNKYGEVHGTAYAAAHVTAAIALAKAKFADKVSNSKIITTLLSEEGSDYLQQMERFTRGGNRLNVVKFLAALDK